MTDDGWKRGRVFRKGRDLDFNWAVRIERELLRRLDLEQIRHLVERLVTQLRPEQRELIIARLQLLDGERNYG